MGKPFGYCGLLLCVCGIAGAWTPDVPGQNFRISPADLPSPAPAPDTDKAPPTLAWPSDVAPQAPKGFTVSVFARIPTSTGWMAVASNGDVFLSEPATGKILLLRDSDGVGRADQVITFSQGFQRPHGLALRKGWLYVSDVRTVWRIPYADGATGGGKPELVSKADGSAFEDKAMARDLAFDAQGAFYWGFASRQNDAEDPEPDATILKIEPDGASATFASGMSTVAAVGFYPGTDDLFATVDERHGLGPGLVPDYFTHVAPGAFFGWPYAYIGGHPDPVWGAKRPDMVAKSATPDLLFEAGSTPMGFAFYNARQFPQRYRGDAFLALHGSWKQGAPAGYKIVHVPFRHGRPSGGYDNFLTGFLSPDGKNVPAHIFGRPTDIAVAKDGSLLISDDVGGTIWRVAYIGK